MFIVLICAIFSTIIWLLVFTHRGREPFKMSIYVYIYMQLDCAQTSFAWLNKYYAWNPIELIFELKMLQPLVFFSVSLTLCASPCSVTQKKQEKKPNVLRFFVEIQRSWIYRLFSISNADDIFKSVWLCAAFSISHILSLSCILKSIVNTNETVKMRFLSFTTPSIVIIIIQFLVLHVFVQTVSERANERDRERTI